MRRKTKRRLSTFVGCLLAGVTLTGPLGGDLLADWQCRHGWCTHRWHWT